MRVTPAHASQPYKASFDILPAYRPRPELQKVAPRNFDAFLLKGKKTVKIPAVPRSRALAIQGFGRAIPPFHVAIKRQLQRKEDIMSDTINTTKIAELNDLCRKAMGVGGKLFQTQGIDALPEAEQSAIREKVERFDAFSKDNDPYGERDFGALDHEGNRIFWKIDYYDRSLTKGSENPADSAQTVRVLTIMLASEY